MSMLMVQDRVSVAGIPESESGALIPADIGSVHPRGHLRELAPSEIDDVSGGAVGLVAAAFVAGVGVGMAIWANYGDEITEAVGEGLTAVGQFLQGACDCPD